MNVSIEMLANGDRIVRNQFGTFLQRKSKRTTGTRRHNGKIAWYVVEATLNVQPRRGGGNAAKI
jgi:hypothetical protein